MESDIINMLGSPQGLPCFFRMLLTNVVNDAILELTDVVNFP